MNALLEVLQEQYAPRELKFEEISPCRLSKMRQRFHRHKFRRVYLDLVDIDPPSNSLYHPMMGTYRTKLSCACGLEGIESVRAVV